MGSAIRLLIVVKHLDGGTGLFVSQLIRLNQVGPHGLAIRVAVLKAPQHGTILSLIGEYRLLPQDNLFKGRYAPAPRSIASIFQEVVWLRGEIEQYNPDIVLGVDTHCCFLISLLKTIFRPKVCTVLTFHNNVQEVFRVTLFPLVAFGMKMACSILFRRADVVVGVSNGLTSQVKDFFGFDSQAIAIPYGLSDEVVVESSRQEIPAAEREIFFGSGPVVLSVGRFEAQKDFYSLIKAFKQVVVTFPNARLVILGDGSEKVRIIECISEAGLENSVYLLGWKSNSFPYMKHASVFVLSSRYEGFSYVILEAMACGAPVVSTDSPYGPAELLGEGRFGRLVPVGDINGLANTILLLLENPQEASRLRKLSLSRSTEYRLDSMLNSYERLFSSLLRHSSN